MTAKTKDGQVVFTDRKIYMLECTDSRGFEQPSDVQIYGSQRKRGYIADSTFMPLQTKVEKYDIKFPYEDVMMGKKKVRNIKAKEMDIEIVLRWQAGPDPGKVGTTDSYVLYQTTERVSIR